MKKNVFCMLLASISIACAVGLISFLSSCNKNDDNKNSIILLSDVKKNGWSVPGLPFRTASNSGVKHNQFLEKVCKMKNFDSRSTADLMALMKEEFPDEYGVFLEAVPLDVKSDNFIIETVDKSIKQLVANRTNIREILDGSILLTNRLATKSTNHFDTVVVDVFCSIKDVMLNPEIVDDVFQKGEIQSIKDAYLAIYSEVSNNKLISTEEQRVLSESLDIAFASNLFWLDVMKDESNEWHSAVLKEVNGSFKDYFGFDESELPNYSTYSRRLGRNWWRFLFIGIADLGGAIVGGVAGGLVGSLFSPVVGTAIGAASGALIYGGAVSATLMQRPY